MPKLRKKHLAIVLAQALLSTGALAASCSQKNALIGYEISALGPMSGSGASRQYLFGLSPIRCDANGTVVYTSSLGFSDGYQLGWYTPNDIRSSVMNGFLYNMRAFEGWCRLHYIGVHKNYSGTIEGTSLSSYPVRSAPYLNVFEDELHLQVGSLADVSRRDSIANQSTNLCNPPEQFKTLPPQQCTAVGNPILPGQACKVQREADYAAAGVSPIEFVRSYSSQHPYHHLSAMTRPLGNRWRHNYEIRLNPQAGANQVLLLTDDGSILHFTPKAGSSTEWVGDADVVGKLTKGMSTWTYRSKDDVVDTFDTEGKLKTRVLRDGRSLSFGYDTKGRLISVTDNFGHTLVLAYNAVGLLSEVTDLENQKITYTYDAGKSLQSVTYPDTRVRSYSYTSVTVAGKVEPALLTGLTDENGTLFASWSYDASAQPISSEHAGGVDRHTLVYQKDANGKIINATVTGPLGAVAEHAFQPLLGVSRPASISHALLPGVTRTYTYDAQGNVASRTDFNGNLTTYAYDLSRNLEVQRVEASGTPAARTITTEWHPTLRVPLRVAEPLKHTTYTYDAIGNVLTRAEQATTDADGSQGFGASPVGTPRVWNWTYNAYGQPLTADGPRTDVADATTYAYYDAADPDPGKRGNLATVTNALGHVTQVTAYDASGRPLTIVDPNGLVTQLTYDARGRLLSKLADNEETRYAYDGVGQLTRVTLPDGSTLDYTYDPAHRLTGVSDNAGNAIVYTLDNAGNRIREEVRDPGGQIARLKTRIFDGLSRLAEELGAQNQSLVQYGYDAQGNLVDITTPLDAGTRTTTQAFDGLNRLIRIVDADMGQIHYGYDGQDRLVRVIDPRNLVTTYTLDGLGNRTELNSPDTGVSASTHDEAGNEITRTDAKGQTSRRAFDALGRVTEVVWDDGSRDLYLWDQGSNAIGRLSRIEQRAAGGALMLAIDYAYDLHGRRIGESRLIDGVAHLTEYRYTAGRLTGLTYPGGKRIDYALNAVGQVSEVRLTDLAGQVTTIATDIAYHPFGGLKQLTNGAGQLLEWAQDADGRPVSYVLGGQTWQLGYDAASRIIFQTKLDDAAQTATYGYDALDRLTQAVGPTTTHTYDYDATGNRTSQTSGAATRSYTIDAASNRLVSIAGSDPRGYAYDANGSMTADGAGMSATYDARGRMVSATAAGATTTYHLDPLGQRIRKTGAEDTVYHYDQQGQLIAETAPDGTVRREYLWLGGQPLAVIQ